MTSLDELPPLDGPIAERLFAPGDEEEASGGTAAGTGSVDTAAGSDGGAG
jgi:hypothetical protein